MISMYMGSRTLYYAEDCYLLFFNCFLFDNHGFPYYSNIIAVGHQGRFDILLTYILRYNKISNP